MTLKTAAFLALAGMVMLGVVAAVDFINAFLGWLRDLIPAMAFLRSFVYLLASLSLVVFFYVFHRRQS